jgi:hypothetical protein
VTIDIEAIRHRWKRWADVNTDRLPGLADDVLALLDAYEAEKARADTATRQLNEMGTVDGWHMARDDRRIRAAEAKLQAISDLCEERLNPAFRTDRELLERIEAVINPAALPEETPTDER